MVEPPPGVTGPIGVPVLKSKAPKAWRQLMRTVTERGPAQLSKAAKARHRMLRR